jgi:outer membrane receptor protein involved in Fe transport
MIRSILFLIVFLIGINHATAQPGGKGKPASEKVDGTKLTGKVLDEAGIGVPYANVMIYTSDSTFKNGAATDVDGNFTLHTNPGQYYLKISFLSYETKFVSNIFVTAEPKELGSFTLKSGSETLGEVFIEAERPQMELKLDKRVFNVDKDMSNKGASASDILDNIPSVTVDVEGNVSLRGSGNVRILIDGKPSGLTGISSNDALRLLQGDLVEKIEIITNPSARYDAEGEVGIINIILKKEKQKGLNGTFNANVGYPDNYGASFNLNARTKKANFFTSYGVRYRDRPGSGASTQNFFYDDTAFSYDRTRTHSRAGTSHNFRLGTDLDLTKKSTLTLSGMYKFADGSNDASLIYTDFDVNNVQTQVVTRTEDEFEGEDNTEIALNFRKTFKKEEQLFTFDAKWMDGGETELADLLEISDDLTVPSLAQRTSSIEADGRWLFQTDYIHPLGKEGKFETGAKAQLRTLDTEYKVEEQNSDASWYVLPAYDNRVIYDENIYAAYAMAGNKSGNFSYQGGLRAEYSDITTYQRETDSTNNRKYLNLFPSAHLSYELKENSFVQLSYSRRVSRPRHWWLMPFFGLADNRNYFSGNPDLNPEYTHSLETGYLKQWDRGSLLSSVYYRHTIGVMERMLTSDSVGFTVLFPVNLGVEDSYGIEFSGSFEPTKWWSMNGSYNFYRAIREGSYLDQDFSRDTWAWNGRISSKWTFKRKFSCQTSFNYRSKQITTQGKSLASYNWDAGFALDIFKGDGTLTFSAKDILNTRKRRHETYGDTWSNISEFQWRSRQFTLSLSYRLNQKKEKGRKGGGSFSGGDDGGM